VLSGRARLHSATATEPTAGVVALVIASMALAGILVLVPRDLAAALRQRPTRREFIELIYFRFHDLDD
jgi:hypothetical protein